MLAASSFQTFQPFVGEIVLTTIEAILFFGFAVSSVALLVICIERRIGEKKASKPVPIGAGFFVRNDGHSGIHAQNWISRLGIYCKHPDDFREIKT